MAGLTSTLIREAPRQREIVEALKERIIAGDYVPGDRIPSVTEIAAAHNASTRTAQNALMYLQENGFVTSRSGAGSYVSEAPPHLTHFALVFNQAPEPDGWWSQYYVAWKREAERFVAPNGEGGKRGCRFSFLYLNEFVPNGGPAAHELMANMGADLYAGLILPNLVSSVDGLLNETKTPKVACTPQPAENFMVLGLAGPSARKALSYLADRGRRKVAFIFSSVHRREALPSDNLIEIAREHGLTSHRHWVQSVDIEAPQWATNLTELICRSGDERPDALIIMDDNLVPDATQGLLNAGIRVPEDMDVVAHCNFPYPTLSRVPAKRFGYDIRDIFNRAVRLIDASRAGMETPANEDVACIFDHELPYQF